MATQTVSWSDKGIFIKLKIYLFKENTRLVRTLSFKLVGPYYKGGNYTSDHLKQELH